MATTFLAMWLQESDAASNRHLIFILVLIIAVAVVGMAVVLVMVALKALTAVKEITATTNELKGKLLPLLDEATSIAKSGRQVLEDATPKIKSIGDSLVKVSNALADSSQVAKTTVQKLEVTVSDANQRTQRQVARVDGMVTTVLDTTAEIIHNVNHGVRVPAQKIAAAATQARYAAEGLLAKFKSMTGTTPFNRKPKSSPASDLSNY